MARKSFVRAPLEDFSDEEPKSREKTYKTAELGLAVALSLRFPIIRIDRYDLKRGVFIFDWNERLPELEKKFWQGNLKVDAKAYYGQLRDLKTRLLRSQF